jgi:hypothetical protein
MNEDLKKKTEEYRENNYTEEMMFSSLGGRDLPEKYGRARSTDRDSVELTPPPQIILENDKSPRAPKKLKSPKKLQEDKCINMLKKNTDYDNLKPLKVSPRKVTATPDPI